MLNLKKYYKTCLLLAMSALPMIAHGLIYNPRDFKPEKDSTPYEFIHFNPADYKNEGDKTSYKFVRNPREVQAESKTIEVEFHGPTQDPRQFKVEETEFHGPLKDPRQFKVESKTREENRDSYAFVHFNPADYQNKEYDSDYGPIYDPRDFKQEKVEFHGPTQDPRQFQIEETEFYGLLKDPREVQAESKHKESKFPVTDTVREKILEQYSEEINDVVEEVFGTSYYIQNKYIDSKKKLLKVQVANTIAVGCNYKENFREDNLLYQEQVKIILDSIDIPKTEKSLQSITSSEEAEWAIKMAKECVTSCAYLKTKDSYPSVPSSFSSKNDVWIFTSNN